MKYIVTVNDKSYEVEVEQGEARVLSVSAALPASPAQVGFSLPAASAASAAAAAGAAAVPGPAAAAQAPAAAPAMAGEALLAPMPGTILAIMKNPGDQVKAGETVLIMEAMKMENEIVAMSAGTITQILVSKGASVTTGEPLAMIV